MARRLVLYFSAWMIVSTVLPLPAAASTISLRSAPSAILRAGAAAGCDHGMRYKIDKSGGTFNVPRCSGWSATINYPPTGTGLGYHLGVTSSLTNTFGAPPPKSGTAIFYIQMTNRTRTGEPNFQMTGVMNTIASTRLMPSHTYTLNVYNLANTDQCLTMPCPPWTLNIGAPNPSTNSITFSSPLNGALFATGQSGGVPIVWQLVQN